MKDLDFNKEIDFDKLDGEELFIDLSNEKLAKVTGGQGGDEEDEGFPCPCGGTFYLFSQYARSYCYKCNKCGKSLVQGCF